MFSNLVTFGFITSLFLSNPVPGDSIPTDVHEKIEGLY